MMKINFALLLVVLVIVNACKKKDDPSTSVTPTVETEKYSAKVNGIVYAPALENVYIDTFKSSGVLITQIIADKGEESIVLQFAGKTVGTYSQAGPMTNPQNVAIYYKGTDSAFICSNSSGGGSLVITKFDIGTGKVSGTFNFSADSFFGTDIKRITEGSFENVNIQ